MPILSFTETININFINTKFWGTKHINHKYMSPYTVPVDHRVRLKESEKKDKYLDLGRKLKKL